MEPSRSLWRALGPGLITGAADDDPSGIATYSQAGAQFGYSLTWTVLLTLPFMVAIQLVSAAIGWSTRRGLAHALARRLPSPVLFALVGSLLVANTFNIAADLAAMGEGVRLLAGGPARLYAALLGTGCLVAEVVVPYHRYAGYLKYLTFVLFAYVAAAFSVHVPWAHVVRTTLFPAPRFERGELLTTVAVFGTTISPYLFFWQASQEAEEARLVHARGFRRGALGPGAFRHMARDTGIGMIVSNAVAFFIIVTTAATLHEAGQTHIETAAQAAEALRPIAGAFTFALFAAGIVGTGLLAVPVLAGSAAYALAETLRLRGSLELPPARAIGFYAIIGAATLLGVALTFTGVDPIAMLFWSAVANGVVSVPIMAATMLAARGSSDHAQALPRWLVVLGWLAVLLMGGTVLLWLGSSFAS
ncbi:MAG TPA: divalent metal cation transporter [Myxococcota bacterium]|nr:divalent metal cation transporter [Myxococcota bacterium]